MITDKMVGEAAIKQLVHRARTRAAALKREARNYWQSDPEVHAALKARAERFRRLEQEFSELLEPDAFMYPATGAGKPAIVGMPTVKRAAQFTPRNGEKRNASEE